MHSGAEHELADPHVLVLVGATGDLSRRKLLPGLLHLYCEGLASDTRIVGTSLDDLTTEEFVELAREACQDDSNRKVSEEQWREFADRLSYVPTGKGPGALADKVAEEEKRLAAETGADTVSYLHYLSVPPSAALAAVHALEEAGLVENSRIIMEKPFGTDLESARALNHELHQVFAEDQIYRIDHFLGKEAAQNILAFRFANGLFEPIWNRDHIDHVQIDVPETLGLETRASFYEATGAYRD
ncbi:MAG: glucose-6-phosphate dehydrogenase, partial [Nocardioides sp.]